MDSDTNIVWFVLMLAVNGLVIGALGRLLVPGRQPIGMLGTILAGIGGSFVGGLAGRLLFGPEYVPGLIMSALGAALLIWIVAGSRRRHHSI